MPFQFDKSANFRLMGSLARTSAVVAALLVPAVASAQVTSVFGRTGAVTAQTNDYGILQINGNLTSYSISPKVGVGLVLTGEYGAGLENNLIDARAANGYVNLAMERYNISGGTITNIGAHQPIGNLTASPGIPTSGGATDPVGAGVSFATTESQTTTNQGMWIGFAYKKSGASQPLEVGMAVNPQGLGGVTIPINAPTGGNYSGPTDLGEGTLNAADSVATGNHFRTTGAAGTVSACGSSPSVHFGTDQAGAITNGTGTVTSCTYTFAKSWASVPVCIVQSNAIATASVASESTVALTVSFSSSFNGTWQFICMGIS